MKRFTPVEQAEYICRIGQRSRKLFWGNISRKISPSAPAKSTENISPTQLQLLHTVANHGPISITDLAKIMAVSPTSISVMVDRMVNNGWLHRARSAQDRRKMMISVSPETNSKIVDIQKVVRQEILHLIQIIGPENTRNWCTVLNEIEQAYLHDSAENIGTKK
jgi:DNA-binding MarR family transcriptional regulator